MREQSDAGGRRATRARGKRPLYRAVSDALRKRMTDGDWTAGTRLPALRELAAQFDVSTITVRQALRLLEREGHVECIPAVGVFVRPAFGLRAGTEQMTIALATIEIEGAFTNQIAHSIEAACQERGWALQILNAQADPGIEARNLTRLAKSGASGAVIVPTCENENLEEIMRLKLNDFPFVLVDRAIPGVRVDVISSDHEKGAYMGTEHLLRHGHTRVLHVTQPSAASSIAARIHGYERAMLDHGIEPLREWRIWIDPEAMARGVRERHRWLGACEAARAALRTIRPPVAVFGHNAYSGWGVFEACRELKLRVPQDVSIICFDDADFLRALHPPMDVVAQRADEIGHAAVAALERRLQRGALAEPQQTLIDVDLIERGSVASVASS